MGAYDRIKAALELVGDTAGGIRQVMFGTIGDLEEYPTGPDNEGVSRALDTGSLWSGDLIPPVLEAIADEIDSAGGPAAYLTWGRISTSATGVAPVLEAGRNIASVSKNEGADSLTITIDSDYDSVNYVCYGVLVNNMYHTKVSSVAAGSFTLQFYVADGSTIWDINSREVMVFAIGQAA